jgi:hypothetical protein
MLPLSLDPTRLRFPTRYATTDADWCNSYSDGGFGLRCRSERYHDSTMHMQGWRAVWLPGEWTLWVPGSPAVRYAT